MLLSRREALTSFTFTGAALAATRWAGFRALAADPAFPGMVVRQDQPRNLEFPFSQLRDWKTPTEHFYVRSHFPVPEIKAEEYRLSVSGHVATPLQLTLADLRKLEPVTKPLMMECAGNGRINLVPVVRGLQWDRGAVGNAEWTGVPLSTILERAGVKRGAVEVLLVGADKGAIASDPATPGAIHYDRSLPIEKALKPEVILALKMNGEDLTPAHGFPLRAVIGGWYGMAAVKWLTRIVVLDRPHAGYFQTMDYSYFVRDADGIPSVAPVTAVQPKASISRPVLDEVVPAGKPYTVFGAAWSGESPVKSVDVSTDGGQTWKPAELERDAAPFCWRFWKFAWNVPATAGRAKIVARATDASGASQPATRDTDRRTYMINHLAPVEVLIR